MAIELQNKVNVQAPSGAWPYGKTLDDTGANDGTPLNHDTLTDYIQFFARLASEAGITFNGLPDNSTNGWQYIDALKMATRPGLAVVSISANALLSTYTAVYGRYLSQVLLDFSGQALAITFALDALSAHDDGTLIILKNNGDYTVTVTPDGAETINGQASVTLLPGQQRELMASSAAGDWKYKYGTNESMTVGVGAAPAFGASWAAVLPVQFKKTNDGKLIIDGVVSRTAPAGANDVFTLPVGYRPLSAKSFSITYFDGVNTFADIMTIGTDGKIKPYGGTGVTGFWPAVALTYLTMNCCVSLD